MSFALPALILAAMLICALARGERPIFSLNRFDNMLTSFGMWIINVFLLLFSIFAAVEPAIRNAYDRLGIPHVDPAVWSGMHPALIILIGLLAKDFADYWNHRAMHMRLVWPIHAIHHSDEDVNGFTTFRIHIFEALFMQASYVVIISWLGLPPFETAATGIALALLNAYVHFDLDWDHGPLRGVVASPRFHRWHHADVPEAHGKNLANIFPFYDILFGTYYMPGHCKAPMGAKAMGVRSTDLAALITHPVMAWGRMLRRTVSPRRGQGVAERALGGLESVK